MADKRDQERLSFGQSLTQVARELGDAVRKEASFAVTDIRHKLVEEAAYGRRTTPPWRDSHDPGEKAKEVDIHGNGGPEERPSDIGSVERTHEERMNTADAAAHIERNVTSGDNTAREIDAQIYWENSRYPQRPAGNDIQPRSMSFDQMFAERIGMDSSEGRGRDHNRDHAMEP